MLFQHQRHVRRIVRRRSRRSLLALTAVFALLAGIIGLVPAAPASASGNAAYECVETLPAGTYGNVEVAEHQSCIFEPGVTIEGNFKAKNPVNIFTAGATIHGNVTINGATGQVAITSGPIDGSTTHIYGDVTVKNTDQSEIPLDLEPVVFVGGQTLGPPPFAGGERYLYSTLHVHGNLTMKDNNVFDFFAGDLFSELIVDGNVTVKGNMLSDLDLHVYSMDIGGNLTVQNNTAQAFTSLVCNNVQGNVTVKDNFNPGVDPGFGPVPGAVWAEVRVRTNCADFFDPDIPIGISAVNGNLKVEKNVSGDGNNDFARFVISNGSVSGNMSVNRNEVNALELLDDSFITIESSDIAGNLTCKKNNIDPIADGYGSGPNETIGNDKCFGDELAASQSASSGLQQRDSVTLGGRACLNRVSPDTDIYEFRC